MLSKKAQHAKQAWGYGFPDRQVHARACRNTRHGCFMSCRCWCHAPLLVPPPENVEEPTVTDRAVRAEP